MRVAELLVAVLAAGGCGMSSDHGLEIKSDVACPSCTIGFEDVVTLKGVQYTGPSTTIAYHPAGTVYLRDSEDGLLKVYGQDGAFLRQVGRSGGAPGEYEVIRNIVVSPDSSIEVLDAVLGRRSRFSQGGEFLGEVRVGISGGVGFPAVLLPGSRMVVNVRSPSRPGPTTVLLVIDREGNTTPLQGADSNADPQRPWLAERILAVRSNGDLLVGNPYEFCVDIYVHNAPPRRLFERVAEWTGNATPMERPSDGVFDRPFTPRLTAVWEDSHGLLWLQMIAPSARWTPKEPPASGSRLTREAHLTLAHRPRIETILEVIDAKRGQVIARSRVEGSVGFHIGEGYLVSTEEDSLGEQSLRVTRAQLNRGSEGLSP